MYLDLGTDIWAGWFQKPTVGPLLDQRARPGMMRGLSGSLTSFNDRQCFDDQ